MEKEVKKDGIFRLNGQNYLVPFILITVLFFLWGFARAILEKRDIVLHTDGTTSRCYCYLGDAVTAIETILEKGEAALPYTVANEETYCSVREMAEMLCAAYPESGSKVIVDLSGGAGLGFAPPYRMKLDCSRLKSLGWMPKVCLMDAFRRMIAEWGESQCQP